MEISRRLSRGKCAVALLRSLGSEFAPMIRQWLASQNPGDWQAGYNAGMSGGSPEVTEQLAYANGFIAGKAARSQVARSGRLRLFVTRLRIGLRSNVPFDLWRRRCCRRR
jgi:hypothetical protein